MKDHTLIVESGKYPYRYALKCTCGDFHDSLTGPWSVEDIVDLYHDTHLWYNIYGDSDDS